MFLSKVEHKVYAGIAVVLLVVLGGVGFVLNVPYSQGYRDGEIQKFSHKGFVRKSYEGDLASVGSSRSTQAIGNVFHFSVKDRKIAKMLQDLPPFTRVRLHYNEYLWTFNVSTTYLITKVDVLR